MTPNITRRRAMGFKAPDAHHRTARTRETVAGFVTGGIAFGLGVFRSRRGRWMPKIFCHPELLVTRTGGVTLKSMCAQTCARLIPVTAGRLEDEEASRDNHLVLSFCRAAADTGGVGLWCDMRPIIKGDTDRPNEGVAIVLMIFFGAITWGVLIAYVIIAVLR